MTVFAWTEIEAFYNIRKYASAHPEILNGNSTVLYRAKVKLHGTNAAIQCHADGRVIAQSRTSELSVGNDNAGFAAWVKAHEEYWRADDSPSGDLRRGMVIYGEWIGPGIQKNVAVSSIPEKSFVIFAARPMGEPNPNTIMGSSHMKDGKIVENDFAFAEDLVVEPAALEAMQHKCPDTYILPWFWPNVFPIDWNQNPDMLQAATNVINQAVEGVEAEDPWVKRVFGVKGTGEGLVFYPVSKEHLGLSNFNNLVFKAKGEKHKNIKTAAPADVNPAVAASVDAFVEMVLTPARLDQGTTAVGGLDMKLTGKFVAWCLADVQKETTDELEASQLDWKQVQKPLGDKARSWFLEQAKK